MNINYLAKSRIENGLTRYEVAAYLGVTSGVVSHWENGVRVPRPDSIIKLCKLLNMDANILLGLKE